MDYDFLLSLLTIISIDIILGGDNAIIVALACRNLPVSLRNRAIVLGITLAIVLRVILTLTALHLLEVPFLQAIGGALLLFIAFQLLTQSKEEQAITGETHLWNAIKTIVIADLIMGFDNVIGVAGAAHGNTTLVMLGLAISVPIIIWGSKLILILFEKFPFIIYLGAGILALTATRMISHEPMLSPLFIIHPLFKLFFQLLAIIGVIAIGWSVSQKSSSC